MSNCGLFHLSGRLIRAAGNDQRTKKGFPVTPDQLRVFVAVAERQHVTEASRALNLAQSAASSAIATLEARHGTKLFNRIGRNIELTEAGRAFLQEARAVLARAEAAELALVEFGNLKRGVLSVQASQTIAGYWLPRHLAAFRRAYPLIDIRLDIGNTAQVVAAIDVARDAEYVTEHIKSRIGLGGASGAQLTINAQAIGS
jgi:DNA-binding transcriptional LysR family regulator